MDFEPKKTFIERPSGMNPRTFLSTKNSQSAVSLIPTEGFITRIQKPVKLQEREALSQTGQIKKFAFPRKKLMDDALIEDTENSTNSKPASKKRPSSMSLILAAGPVGKPQVSVASTQASFKKRNLSFDAKSNNPIPADTPTTDQNLRRSVQSVS